MEENIKYKIIDKLKQIEKHYNVKIIFAIESGSRAWGFESKNSDYDVRFVYIRKTEDYLKLSPYKDVIEWELNETFDICGWDIVKTLRLVFKSNPTIFEWLSSPIIYKGEEEIETFKKLAEQYFSPLKSLFHYKTMAINDYVRYLKAEKVILKKYFYALRPILAAKWIIEYKTQAPMLFEELMESQLEKGIKKLVNELVKLKQNSLETNMIEKNKILNQYIESEIKYIESNIDNFKEKINNFDLLDEYFIELLKKY